MDQLLLNILPVPQKNFTNLIKMPKENWKTYSFSSTVLITFDYGYELDGDEVEMIENFLKQNFDSVGKVSILQSTQTEMTN